MLSDFMITSYLRAPARVALVAVALSAVACQRVPLLAPTGSTITLTSLATSLSPNGTTTITAQVIEPAGTPPHAGTLVAFSTNLGRMQPAEVETDISGRATTTFVAGGASGTATIMAISGGVSAGTEGAVKIAVGSAAASGIVMSASPLSLPAAGGSSTIFATVNDNSGNVLSGIPVAFSTDAGSLSLGVVNTDSTGVARTILTTGRTARVTATAGVSATSGTTTTTAPSNTITVTVNAAATVVFGAFSANPTAGVPVTTTLTITPSTGSAIRNVVVNFGDGRTQTLGAVSGPVPLSHTYRSSGTFSVTATVTDSNGDTFSGVAQVGVGAPSVSIGAVQADDGDPVTFTATMTPAGAPVDHYEWKFGDVGGVGDRSTTSNTTSHNYLNAGDYTVTVTAVLSEGVRATSVTEINAK
jgi:PKD repeat protein